MRKSIKKLVKLSLEGTIEDGYQVELVEIREDSQDGKIFREGDLGSLPPALEIYRKYQELQYKDTQFDFAFRGLRFSEDQELPTNISIDEWEQLAGHLKEDINTWLDDPGFHKIEKAILIELGRSDDVRFMIRTTDHHLWKIPWSTWDFFDEHPNAEVVFSCSEPRSGEKPIRANPRKQVRILAIGGDSNGIDYNKDLDNLKHLRSVGAQTKFEKEPTLQRVRNLLWNQCWDIFFFAGHSDSESDFKNGTIYVNSEESLTPNHLEISLKKAIDRGLKLAFFNSCDGLGLAHQLVNEFGIPLVIAMREPVPDQVAQKFLEYFLLEYAYRELPLHLAVRQARERIAEEYRDQLPGIDWLPVICQNPAIRPPSWKDLYRRVSFKQATFASLVSTSVVLLARSLGLLQPFDLWALDQLMRMRPIEQTDERILIVKVTESDLKKEGQYPISDKTIEQVLTKLEQYQPRAIGLDIYRGEKIRGGEGRNDLLKHLKESDRVISICTLQEPNSDNADDFGVQPPPEILPEHLGFADVPVDKDGTIRRQFLTMKPAPEDDCQTELSFSFKLAYSYLEKEKSINLSPEEGDDYLQFTNESSSRFKLFEPYTGGYQKLDEEEIGGFQVLLNYRASKQIAEEVSFSEVLNDSVKPNQVINRVVLIGYTAKSVRDIHFTTIEREMPGVMIQAHMVSQILSAILDGRPLIWTWSWWGDYLWVLSYSLVGSLLIWRIRKPLLLALSQGVLVIVLPLLCLIILIQGGWMPFIPSVGAFVSTVGGLLIYVIYPNWQQK